MVEVACKRKGAELKFPGNFKGGLKFQGNFKGRP